MSSSRTAARTDDRRRSVAGTANRDGSILRFMTSLLSKYGMNWDFVDVSRAAQEQHPESMWTACTYDVALNNTDL